MLKNAPKITLQKPIYMENTQDGQELLVKIPRTLETNSGVPKTAKNEKKAETIRKPEKFPRKTLENRENAQNSKKKILLPRKIQNGMKLWKNFEAL